MRYSLLAPGKRIRPLLTMAAVVDLGWPIDMALDPACAIEMIHTASLVMDDLPAMDNATLRRGQPTTHRAFGEDIAMLASVALLNNAFGIVARARQLNDATRLRLVTLLAEAVGPDGLAAGQEEDLHLPACARQPQALEKLNYRKTGVLFIAALEVAGCIANLAASRIDLLRECGWHLGLAFQLADDLLDQHAASDDIGKDVCQDDGKLTLSRRVGPQKTRLILGTHLREADDSLIRAGASGGALSALIERTFETVTA